MSKLFECFWGDGYRGDDNRSILAYHDEAFFNDERGYSPMEIDWVKGLEVDDLITIDDATGDHWIRRIS